MCRVHGFCKVLFKDALNGAYPAIRQLFKRKNVGITRSGNQFAVEFVKNLNGQREVLWVKADCVSHAKAEVIFQLCERMEEAS